MVVSYSALNATEMRLALDAPALADEWVLQHQQHLDAERKEEEEEARLAAQQVAVAARFLVSIESFH